MTIHPRQQLFCFVDESGQDTKGKLFLVSVVVTDQEHEQLSDLLVEIEASSGKGLSKWRKAAFARRLAYIEAVISKSVFIESIFLGHYAPNTQDYVELTVAATAQAITAKATANYTATVTVDGLTGGEVQKFKHRLRQRQINAQKVRGARDESSPLIRLADAVAGFMRDYLEGQEYAQTLYQKARSKRVIIEL